MLSWITRRSFVTKDGETIPAGTRVFRRMVDDPGAQPTYGLEKAAAATEAEWPTLAQPTLRRWVREQEQGGRRA